MCIRDRCANAFGVECGTVAAGWRTMKRLPALPAWTIAARRRIQGAIETITSAQSRGRSQHRQNIDYILADQRRLGPIEPSHRGIAIPQRVVSLDTAMRDDRNQLTALAVQAFVIPEIGDVDLHLFDR